MPPTVSGRALSGLRSFVLGLAFLGGQLHAELSISRLRCGYLHDPQGISSVVPRLSWMVDSPVRGERQTGFRILVASSREILTEDQGDLWDSGKVEGDATQQVYYAGKPLGSRARCYWKVRSWDKDGTPSGWSNTAEWSMGLLDASDWGAKWINAVARQVPRNTSTLPVITHAVYEAVDGSAQADVSGILIAMANRRNFTLDIANTVFGGDPAYHRLKRLRVSYRVGGNEMVRFFAENSRMQFPDDLTPPPKIVRATYETLDGSGNRLDVTQELVERSALGDFSVKVDNTSLGDDPARLKVKHLRVEYVENGVRTEKTIPENQTFHYPSDLERTPPLPYLRRAFTVSKPVTRARLYATALGVYEMRLNGHKIGDHVLAPEWTDYAKRLNYQEYDVTAMLRPGRNALGAQVANGWYSGHIGNGGYQRWGRTPALLAQLEITYQDGTIERVVTDGQWKSQVSPLLASDFMLGEDYDARNEIAGWDMPGFDDSNWLNVLERNEESRRMVGQVMEPVKELMELKPKSLREPARGKWTYDLGQNMVGVVRLKIDAPAGTRLTLRHAEMLNPDGTVYTGNLRGAPSVDHYVCKGGGETWQPKFTFHGFRYVELTGLETKPPMDAVTGVVIGSATPQTGVFTSSDGRLNQLQSNIVWGQRGNYLSVPTDCPQRDERLGWMGDAQVFVRTATYNSDVAAFFSKWLDDVTDSQSTDGRFADVAPFAGPSSGTPAWGDAGVICPWTIYQVYGDLHLLARQYPSMVGWVRFCKRNSTYGIRSGDRGADYGDWLSIGADTDKELIGTAYHAYSTKLVSMAAEVLGKAEEAAAFEEDYQSIRRAFIEKYVTADGQVLGNTQCGYLLALKFGLLPDALRARAADFLEQDIIARNYHLSTGFVGVSYLLTELTKAGKTTTAYRLLMQDTFPSWLFSVKLGATTIWERWDGWTPDKGFQNVIMNSFNHYALGSCGEWLYASVAGISADPSEPGFKKTVIRPVSDGTLTDAAGDFTSVHGRITSAWSSHGDTFVLTVTIPTNTTAEIFVPTQDHEKVTESGKPVALAVGVKFLRMEDGAAVYAVESGRYQFSSDGGRIPGDDRVERKAAQNLVIPIQSLLENDGEGGKLQAFQPRSVHGAEITRQADTLVYAPVAGDDSADRFTYSFVAPDGGVGTRTVEVSVAPGELPKREKP